MPCIKASASAGSSTSTGASYATEAQCLQACKEGACCEGTACSVTPQCQCQGTGKVFKGVGTTCDPNPCECCANGSPSPESIYAVLGGGTQWDQVVILNKLPAGSASSWDSGMESAGFNAAFFKRSGTWWENKTFINCKTYYAMLGGQNASCPNASINSNTIIPAVHDNSIGGFILLALNKDGNGNCMMMLPAKLFTQDGKECCWQLSSDSIAAGVRSFDVCSSSFSVSYQTQYGGIFAGIGVPWQTLIGICVNPGGPSVVLHA